MATDTIPEHFTTQFSTNWISRIAQTKGRLDAFVDFDDFQGERKRYDRVGSQSLQERTERKGPTRIVEVDMDSRWAYRHSYDLANLLDKDDALNLGQLVLPTSQFVKDHAAAYHRAADDVAWSTALGSVITGEAGTTVTSFPAGQAIAAGGTGLTLAKLLTANQILEDADFEDDAPRVLCVTAQQLTNLLNTTQVTNSDYNSVKALVSGQVDTFMGFKFVKIKRLPKVSTTRTCVGWVKGVIKVMRGSRMSDISIRKDLSYSTQIYSDAHLGGVRVHDEGVVTIDCIEV